MQEARLCELIFRWTRHLASERVHFLCRKTGLDIEFNGGIDYALSIIDKYRAVREEEHANSN